MKALSIRQPWLWAILTEFKRVENRSRSTSWRGPVALHASMTFEEDAIMPVAEADERLRRIIREVRLAQGHVPGSLFLTPGIIHAVADITGCHYASDCDGRDWQDGRLQCSPWAMLGSWHWELANLRILDTPVPCKGALGLWHLPEDAEAAVLEQLAARGTR